MQIQIHYVKTVNNTSSFYFFLLLQYNYKENFNFHCTNESHCLQIDAITS